jgi:hypothetical protein
MEKMRKIELSRAPSPADEQTVKEFFYAMPLIERGRPILAEMIWAISGRSDSARPEKILPDYCHHIFDVFQKTYFKGFPLLGETVLVTNPAGLKAAKTIEAAKKVVRLDWKNLGKLFGIGARGVRFVELESADDLKNDGGAVKPDKTEELFTLILGRKWVEENRAMVTSEPAEIIFNRMLNEFLAPNIASFQAMQPRINEGAYQWSPAAMLEFNAGFTEGLDSFLTVDGQLAGESARSGIYGFLLLAWPEIKVMLEASPKKTLRDLHEWMQPFMRVGLTAYLEIDALRDVCAPPPSGIGLSLRPLNSRPRRSSA